MTNAYRIFLDGGFELTGDVDIKSFSIPEITLKKGRNQVSGKVLADHGIFKGLYNINGFNCEVSLGGKVKVY